MKKCILIGILIAVSPIYIIKSQSLTKFQVDTIIMNIKTIPKEIIFNDMFESKYLNFNLYSRFINNYESLDSIYSFDLKGKRYRGTWSGYVEADTSIINIDNTDKKGRPIPECPSEIKYPNKMSVLGRIDLGNNYVVIALKVESYDFFVIHLFCLNQDRKLISVIPAGKIEKGKTKKDWFITQKGKINSDNSITVSYLAEALVELRYVICDNGRFKVTKKRIEE